MMNKEKKFQIPNAEIINFDTEVYTDFDILSASGDLGEIDDDSIVNH